MNLFEKLNRLDDSIVESKRVVKKKKLTESTYDPYPAGAYGDKIFRILDTCSGDAIINFMNEYGYTFYKSGDSMRDVYDKINNYLESNSGYGLWSRLAEYFEEHDYDDDIEEMLTESTEQYELSTLVKDSINHLVNDLDKDPMADDFGDDVCADLENNYDIEVPQDMVRYADWCNAVMSEVSRQLNKVEEQLTENRNNPYFVPYGFKDAAKVLNRKAPEYYYYLKEIEMDKGDGIKLARYALRKGLPVMVNKNSDPDYPEFAIKGEYHWNDYFYPYATAHEDGLIPWDGKMFVEEQLTESIDPSDALRLRKTSDADVIFYGYQYKNNKPVEITPEELSNKQYEHRVNQIVNDYTKLYPDKPTANRYSKMSDFTFYALYRR